MLYWGARHLRSYPPRFSELTQAMPASEAPDDTDCSAEHRFLYDIGVVQPKHQSAAIIARDNVSAARFLRVE